jgi:uncharacterized protein YbaR (Trm112 family)
MISDEMLALLVCPIGRSPLRREGEALACVRCGTRFAIVDDIPRMLVEDATLPEGCATPADLECVRQGDAKWEPA